ncbi:MAG: ABC transporter permease [Chthoniobacteraceae bacterium]
MKPNVLANFLSDYGMIFVLVALCVFFSIATRQDQYPSGEAAGRQLAEDIRQQIGKGARVLIAARAQPEDTLFSATLVKELELFNGTAIVVKGEPSDAREALRKLVLGGGKIDAIAGIQATVGWQVFNEIGKDFPSLGKPRIVGPHSYRGSNFLKSENLINIANQIAVIAIVAIGMTFVIIAGGIDLSVGSLIALAAVVAALLIREIGGGVAATPGTLTNACLAAIVVCGLVGAVSGGVITFCGIPPFIVTLAMMLVSSGLAYLLAKGQSIYQVPDSFVWLGRGANVFGIPNAVLLLIILYVLAHVVMARTTLGRYIYAVGGNVEAAHLSGVPVKAVVLFAYIASGIFAGLGGVIMASQLKSGSPTYGGMYELYVIAAVVVGGTSLKGGQGKMFATLIGAFIIAVIQNGMNLCNVESYTQKVVLGVVILAAVLLDLARQRFWGSSSR